MKQLDPKAVWLFFLNFTVLYWLFGLVIGFIMGQMLLFVNANDKNINLDELWILVQNGFILTLVLVVIFGIVAYIFAKLAYKYYKYELREDGFRKEHGVIWKKYVTIPYERIQNVDIHRGILARILGLSDLQIQTAGMSTTRGSYGAGSEGRLPGVTKEEAERLRDELIKKAQGSKNQGV